MGERSSMTSLAAQLTSDLDKRKRDGIFLSLATPFEESPRKSIQYTSNDYLCLGICDELRELFLQRLHDSPRILGVGGSRVLSDGATHQALERRMASFFNAPSALLASSGFDANLAFFRHIPRRGDVIVHDEYIHASIYDGMHSGKAHLIPFEHNSLSAFALAVKRARREYPGLDEGSTSLFLAVESVYSMDGSIAPLRSMSDYLQAHFPLQNAHLVVDEAHATGIYGTHGKGIVSMFGLEDKCLARLHTFGKALTSNGAVILTTPLIKDYLINYGRALFFTTGPSYTAAISIQSALDMLESPLRDRLAGQLLDTCTYCVHLIQEYLTRTPTKLVGLPAHLDSPISTSIDTIPSTTLPTAIIPLLTPDPFALSEFLAKHNILTAAAVYPLVPRGKQRVRISLNADKTRLDIDRLIGLVFEWAASYSAGPDEGKIKPRL